MLEVGVGTGKNMPYYSAGVQVTVIDLSEGMLARARRQAPALNLDVDLHQMDAQHLTFPADSFGAVVATFVFCSVPVAVQGLREIGRVTRPGGDTWLLEHVRIDKSVIGPLMDLMNPVVVRMMGANINRQTVENVKKAGLRIASVENLKGVLLRICPLRQ